MEKKISVRTRAHEFVTAPKTERFIIGVIILNSIALGLETSTYVTERWSGVLDWLDHIFITIFVIELALKMVAFGKNFPKDAWNVFDFVVVGIALVPGTGPLAVLRALRVLRVFRLVSSIPALRRVVDALAYAIPGIGSIAALLSIVFYVGAVMATNLFGETFPQWFGSVGGSAYSLFQIMTLESWSMGIVRPVMEVHSWAWAFFVPFILLTSFTVLNLFIAVIVDSMTHLKATDALAVEEDTAEAAAGEVAELSSGDSTDELIQKVEQLQQSVDALTAQLRAR